MDSTISVQPGEAPDSLHRARRAAWGSFAGAVVDWYDFLLYGITAALVFNREFFPQIGPAMGTLAAFATFGVGFLFRPFRASPSAANGAARRCSRWRMPRRGKKPFTAAGCRWATASASCSLPGWYR